MLINVYNYSPSWGLMLLQCTHQRQKKAIGLRCHRHVITVCLTTNFLNSDISTRFLFLLSVLLGYNVHSLSIHSTYLWYLVVSSVSITLVHSLSMESCNSFLGCLFSLYYIIVFFLQSQVLSIFILYFRSVLWIYVPKLK